TLPSGEPLLESFVAGVVTGEVSRCARAERVQLQRRLDCPDDLRMPRQPEVIVRGEVHRRPTVHEDPSALTPLDAAEAPAEVLVRQLVQLSLEGGPQPRCRAAFDRCPICK